MVRQFVTKEVKCCMMLSVLEICFNCFLMLRGSSLMCVTIVVSFLKPLLKLAELSNDRAMHGLHQNSIHFHIFRILCLISVRHTCE